jgi:phosphoribosylamine--glycine ligase
MKILVVGGGGREHALVWSIATNPETEVFCLPGNAGTATVATNIPSDPENVDQVTKVARSKEFDLTVIGPEAPLVSGIVDSFDDEGLRIFGPNADAARLEGSKLFARLIQEQAGIPTPRFEYFDELGKALAFVEENEWARVVKADGLAAGKGVIVCDTKLETLQAVEKISESHGESSGILIEERLIGEEASMIGLAGGDQVLPFLASQDYKRAYDNDKGPNTGGMGAIAPTPAVSSETSAAIVDEMMKPVLGAMLKKGIEYCGFLYAGIILTAEGPRILEFNCRMGDPECQAVLPLLNTDLVELMERTIDGDIQNMSLDWKDDTCVCVVMASKGYPESYEKGKKIDGVEEAQSEHVTVFHAGTEIRDSGIYTAGGRVLGISATGGHADEAIQRAYDAVSVIRFEGAHYRTDIARKALKKQEAG